MRRLLPLVAFASLWLPAVSVAQPAMDHSGHDHNHDHHQRQPSQQPHHGHDHSVGPAGSTYDLRWIDAMVQHHIGALRMSEFVFNIGSPGVGALANGIWNEQSNEIKAMGQWRKAW